MKARLFGKYRKGSSTLEIVIAFAILTLALTSVIIMVFGNQSISVDTQTNNEALYKAQTLIEQARANSRQDFNSVSSIPAVTDGIYQKTLDVQVDPADANIKKVTSTVSWIDAGRNVLIKLITLLTNPVFGPQCNETLSGDWQNPQLLGWADVGQNNGATDVFVLSKYGYVTADPSGNGKPNFYVIDVSDPTIASLPVLGSRNTNPSTGAGLAAVYVSGKYAYVANMSTVSQLQVIDISTPSNPTLVKSLKVTPAADTAVGSSIYYANNKIYLGLTKSTGAEFYAVNVADPLNPSVVASFEVNTQVTSIIVNNNVAYIAVPDNSITPAKEQVRVLDVSQAGAGTITQLATAGPNPITLSGEGITLSKDGKTLYLGEGGANPGNKPEFLAFDVTTPSSIGAPNKTQYIGSDVNAVTVRGNLAFLVTDDPSNGFQIWDLNNLGNLYAHINIQQGATGGMSCQGNYIYVAQRSNKAVQIIGPGPVALSSFTLAIHNTLHNTITTVNAGDTVHGAATGAGSTGVPTGTVDFSFYPNSSCGSGAGSAGTTPLVNGVADPSTAEGPLSAGSYSFKAHYNGSFLYSAADSSCMPLTVAKKSPSLTTTPSAGGPVGTPISDTASLTGAYNPTGSVTFNLYAPSDSTCSGVPVFISNKVLAGSSVTSSSFTSSAVGTYHWIASYSGDANNVGVAGQCTDEPVAITAAVPFDYSITKPADISIKRNNSGSNPIAFTLVSGITRPISLTVNGLPSKTSGSFSPTSCSPTCSSTLNITVQNPATPGPYTITITGSPSDVGPRSTTFVLTITN